MALSKITFPNANTLIFPAANENISWKGKEARGASENMWFNLRNTEEPRDDSRSVILAGYS